MTNKQIIIDVTQCPYYKEDETCTYLPYKSKCEGDCNWTTYKELEEKLLRKEQECEELKKINKANAKSYEKHWYKLEKYKQTLTEIKEFVENEMTQNGDTNIILQKISNANTY